MDDQQYYQAQEGNDFFDDGRAMRPPVPGTVARGELRSDPHLFVGKIDGAFAQSLPVTLSRELLLRGRQRFDIYCAPCHDAAGTGTGMVVKRGLVPPPSLQDARLRAMPPGQLFETITAGVRNMPPYAAQILVRDRWAIVAYVRALQASRGAGLEHVPDDIAQQKGWRK